METLIVCLGNERVRDDGIAAVVGRILQSLPLPPDVTVRMVSRVCFDLIDDLADAERLVLVDALSTGGEPGTCTIVDVTDIPSTIASSECAHHTSVAQILDLVRYVGCGGNLPRVSIAAIEGKQFLNCATSFSDEALAAVPRLVDLVLLFVGARLEARAMVEDACRRLVTPTGRPELLAEHLRSESMAV